MKTESTHQMFPTIPPLISFSTLCSFCQHKIKSLMPPLHGFLFTDNKNSTQSANYIKKFLILDIKLFFFILKSLFMILLILNY